MNRVRIDYDDPAIAKALEGCKPGETKTLNITLTADDVGDGFVEGEIDRVTYKKPKPAPMVEEEEDDEDEMPPVIKRRRKMAGEEEEEY